MRICIIIFVFISMKICAQTVNDKFYEEYRAKITSVPPETDRIQFLLAASKGEIASQDIRKYISQGRCRGEDVVFLNIAYIKHFMTGGVLDVLGLIEAPAIDDKCFGLTLLIQYEPTTDSVSWMSKNLHLAYNYCDSDDDRMLQYSYIRALGVLLTYDNISEIDDIYKKIIARQTPNTEFRSKLVATIASMSQNKKNGLGAKCRDIIKKCVLEEYKKDNLIAWFSYFDDDFTNYLQKIKTEQAEEWKCSMSAEKITLEVHRIKKMAEDARKMMEKRSAF